MPTPFDAALDARLAEIDQLREEIEERRRRLCKLLGIKEPAATLPPSNFSYREAILTIFREQPSTELRTRFIVQEIARRHGFAPNPKVVQSSLNNLARTALIKIAGSRGTFRLR